MGGLTDVSHETQRDTNFDLNSNITLRHSILNALDIKQPLLNQVAPMVMHMGVCRYARIRISDTFRSATADSDSAAVCHFFSPNFLWF